MTSVSRSHGEGTPRSRSSTWGIVLAAGRGERFGRPKHDLLLADRPLWSWAVAGARSVCDRIVCVMPPGMAEPGGGRHGVDRVVDGGMTRAESVRSGLRAVSDDAEVVVIADVAHPLADPELFHAVVDAVRKGAAAAVPGLPLAEVCTQVDAAGRAGAPVPRDGVVQVQMPHAFRAAALRAAHADNPAAVEDSRLVAAMGREVVVVPGDPVNLHVVTGRDLEMAARLTDLVTRRP